MYPCRAAFVIGEELHGFVRLEPVALDRGIDLQSSRSRISSILSHCVMASTSPMVLPSMISSMYQPRFLVRIEEDVHLVDAAEEIVQVAHDVLVGADHEKAEVVGLARA